MGQKLIEPGEAIDVLFDQLINRVDDFKPEDRSPTDRHYAILLTELSKVYAYFNTYILNNNERN